MDWCPQCGQDMPRQKIVKLIYVAIGSEAPIVVGYMINISIVFPPEQNGFSNKQASPQCGPPAHCMFLETQIPAEVLPQTSTNLHKPPQTSTNFATKWAIRNISIPSNHEKNHIKSILFARFADTKGFKCPCCLLQLIGKVGLIKSN